MVAQPFDEADQKTTRCPADEPTSRSDHLLGVAGSVTRDASQTWAELWKEFRPHLTSAGLVLPEMERGFIPSCGWPEFLENFWLLKHYLDSISRICHEQR